MRADILQTTCGDWWVHKVLMSTEVWHNTRVLGIIYQMKTWLFTLSKTVVAQLELLIS